MFGFGDPSRTERNDALEARRQELAMAREQANLSIAENTKDQLIMARQEEREEVEQTVSRLCGTCTQSVHA